MCVLHVWNTDLLEVDTFSSTMEHAVWDVGEWIWIRPHCFSQVLDPKKNKTTKHIPPSSDEASHRKHHNIMKHIMIVFIKNERSHESSAAPEQRGPFGHLPQPLGLNCLENSAENHGIYHGFDGARGPTAENRHGYWWFMMIYRDLRSKKDLFNVWQSFHHDW